MELKSESVPKKWMYIATILFIVVISSVPLFMTENLYWGHDEGFHLQRIVSIAEAFGRGEFPVRVYKEVFRGYGYAAPMYYCDLFLYFPAALYGYLGLSITVCWKFLVVFINVLSAVISVYSFTAITDSKRMGLLAAIVYCLSTYRLLDVYTRAAVGESFALALAPLVFCGLDGIRKGKNSWYILALGFSGIIMSHVLSGVLMLAFSLIYVLVNLKEFLSSKKIANGFIAAAVTLMITAWFIGPFILGQSLPLNANTSIVTGFPETTLSLGDFFALGIKGANGNETYKNPEGVQMVKTPGVVLIVGTILLIFILVMRNNEIEEHRNLIKLSSISVVFSFIVSDLFPWDYLSKINFLGERYTVLQFAWRLNVILALTMSVCAVYGYYYFFRFFMHKEVLTGVLVPVVTLVLALVYVFSYTSTAMVMTEYKAYSWMYMDELYLFKDTSINYRPPCETNSEALLYTSYEPGNCTIELGYRIEENANDGTIYVDVPINYYPGYVSYINGERTECTYSDGGVVRVYIPQDVPEGVIFVQHEEREFLLFDIVTAVGALALCVGTVFTIKNRNMVVQDNNHSN